MTGGGNKERSTILMLRETEKMDRIYTGKKGVGCTCIIIKYSAMKTILRNRGWGSGQLFSLFPSFPPPIV